MTTTEHLSLIRAFCERNLALAEKRTPGKWNKYVSDDQIARNASVGVTAENNDVAATNIVGLDFDAPEDNASFIAACAGGAEAGWRATIATIEFIQEFHQRNPQIVSPRIEKLTTAILTAYPLELITT